jgi:phosphoglycerate dehydrogenase-like enzyme
MNSLIVVHPAFDAVWPYAADHFHKLWLRQGPVEFIRMAATDRRPLGQALRAASGAERAVILGMQVTPECLKEIPGVREAVIHNGTQSAVTPDLRAALDKRGVKVFDHPTEGFWSQSVAEFALALTINGLRRIPQAHRHVMHSKKAWDYQARGGVGKPGMRGQQFCDDPHFSNGTLQGKRVRVVGLGNIGSRYASFCHMLGAQVAAWDPVAPEPCFHRTGSRRERRLEQLLRDAEIFAPTISVSNATRNIISRSAVNLLPKGCLVVLVTRTDTIDMAALRERVLNDELALAADTFDVEPLPPDDPLLGRHNVCHTPHMAGRTKQANEEWAEKLAEQFDPV